MATYARRLIQIRDGLILSDEPGEGRTAAPVADAEPATAEGSSV
jgi:hypothetical protein